MITLQYPYTSPTVTIVLPNPTYGNAEQYNLKTKIGVSMSGKVITTISTSDIVKLIYSFDTLLRTHVNALMLVKDADLKITDWNGSIWRVKLLSNPIEYTEYRSFYTCQLEFKGTRIS